jgi:pimeloyl-ACP methyl ester carboxylesterase
VIALGHSLGGCIVSALAVEHPELVRAIVPVDSAYGVAPELIDGVLGPLIEGMKAQGAAGAAPLFERFYTPATPANLPAWHRRRMEACPAHVLWQVMHGLFLAPDQFGQRPESEMYFEGRACPVLSFFADPGRAAWEQTTFRHSASRSVACEGAGHWIHQERPAEFNAITLGWIASLSA